MADDLLQRLGNAAVGKLPLPLQRSMRGVTFRAEGGPTQSIASGSRMGNLAGIIPGQNVINVMDPAAFQRAPEQLAMHEGIHKWQFDLPPAIQAQIPPDDPKNPYQVWDTNRVAQLLAKGGNMANLPKEQAAATGQYYQAQGGDQSAPKAMRDTYGKLIKTMPTLPLSQILPTDPDQKGINTMPRAPLPPMQYAQKTYTKGQPPDNDPPPPAGFTVDSDPAPPAGYTLDAPASPSGPAPTTNTISAAQPESWLGQLDHDLRQGGTRTFVGRGLGHMQGRGDQGYTGLESGQSQGTADFMGSVPLGLTKTAQGVSEIPQHPVHGALKAASGALQAATVPMAFMGGPAADAAIDAIPSRAAASKLFESVMQDAGDVPVTLNQSMSPLERTQQLASRGASPVKAADQLFQRVQTVNPLTYREARDFSSNLSRMSTAEKMATNPTMQRAVGDLSHSFNSDIADAADTVGRGQDYRTAMQEYARAMSLREAGSYAAKKVIPKIAGAAGAGAAYNFFKKH